MRLGCPADPLRHTVLNRCHLDHSKRHCPSNNRVVTHATTNLGNPLPLSPGFNSATTEYAIAAPNTVTSVSLSAYATHSGATVQWLSASDTVLATTASYGVNPLAVGVTVIKVKVTAQDGIATKTFTITRGAAVSNDATLIGLALSDGTLRPGFAATTKSYRAAVVGVTQVTVTPTTASNTATVAYLDGNDAALADADTGTVAHDVALNVGLTTFKIKVTDGTATETYTVTVARAALQPTDPLIYTNYYAGAAFDVMIVFRKNHIHGSPVTGFELDDITVTNGTATNLVDVYGGVVWRVTVTPTDSTRPVTVAVAAGAATVVADGSVTEAGRTLTVLSYAAGPVVGLSIYEDTGVYQAQFVFRGTTTGLDCDTEVKVSGAEPERVFGHIPSNCDMWLRPPSDQGDITIAAGAYEDGDSVANAAFSYTITR